MDAFFVEVERLADPALIGRPVAVGGKGPRGVIASASYEARENGVHSAQPTTIARRLCPDLVVVAPSHGRYREVSVDLFDLFRRVTPLVESVSLDEAFLDVRGLKRHFQSPVDVARILRAEIRDRLGLPASVGIASNKFLAKLASEEAKPDGLFRVSVETQIQFLHGLPATALWGVGPATLAGLARLGVVTVGDIAELPVEALSRALGPTTGRHLHQLANGIDTRRVEPDSEAKSISVEETYDVDLVGDEVIETAVLAHAQRLSSRLHRAGLAARTVTLKARYDDFTTVTRTRTLDQPVDGSYALYQAGLSLVAHIDGSRPVRLLGLGGSALEPFDRPRQLGLERSAEWSLVEDAVAEVRAKFGEGAISPARLVDGEV